MKKANMRGLEILEKGSNSLLECLQCRCTFDSRTMIRNSFMPPISKKFWLIELLV